MSSQDHALSAVCDRSLILHDIPDITVARAARRLGGMDGEAHHVTAAGGHWSDPGGDGAVGPRPAAAIPIPEGTARVT